jgi:hypothetical protein
MSQRCLPKGSGGLTDACKQGAKAGGVLVETKGEFLCEPRVTH